MTQPFSVAIAIYDPRKDAVAEYRLKKFSTYEAAEKYFIERAHLPIAISDLVNAQTVVYTKFYKAEYNKIHD